MMNSPSRLLRIGLLHAALFCAVASASAQDFSFTGTATLAFGVSGDGSTVVGNFYGDPGNGAVGSYSYRWTAADGMQILPMMSGTDYFDSTAYAASYDGSVIVGQAVDQNDNYDYVGYRWTASGSTAGTITALPPPAGGGGSFDDAKSVSADGSVVAGSADNVYRWTQSDNTSVALPLLQPGGNSLYGSVSADGTAIAGAASTAGGLRAFLWTEASGTSTELIIDAAAERTEALGISGDGATVVGSFYTDVHPGEIAFAWKDDVALTLNSLPGDISSNTLAYEASYDGRWVVGESNGLAVLWDTTTNSIWDLNLLLVDSFGFDLDGFTLTSATGISWDGQTIVGTSYNESSGSQGWVATIPEPSTWALLGLGLLIVTWRSSGLRRKDRMVG